MIMAQQLLEILGSAKRNTVTRWIIIARDLDEEVLTYIKGQKNVPQRYITENKYLVGTGSDKRHRLKPAKCDCRFRPRLRKICARPLASLGE